MTEHITIGGYRKGILSTAITAAIVISLAFIVYLPLIFPLATPSRDDLTAISPFMAVCYSVVIAILAYAIWRESRMEYETVGYIALLVIANCFIRETMNPGSGLEFNYVLPFIAGIAGGGPIGFLVGASSALVSQFFSGYITFYLPGQMLVWGAAGLLGAILHNKSTRVTYLGVIPLALVFGLLASLILNFIGWPTETEGQQQYVYSPFIPRLVNLVSFVFYCIETAFWYDFMRAIATTIGVLLLIKPLVAGLQTVFAPKLVVHERLLEDGPVIKQTALVKREKADLVTNIWAEPARRASADQIAPQPEAEK